jgi:DNA-binding response OmpR family regulator
MDSMEAETREPHHDEVPAQAVGRPILVVEDDEDTVAALRMLLADEGYVSITAPDVQQAIAALERADPGLVLLDWSLDDGSGEAVLSAARGGAADPPVVLMTGSSSLNAQSRAADAILKKPFDVGDLLRVVARYYRP